MIRVKTIGPIGLLTVPMRTEEILWIKKFPRNEICKFRTFKAIRKISIVSRKYIPGGMEDHRTIAYYLHRYHHSLSVVLTGKLYFLVINQNREYARVSSFTRNLASKMNPKLPCL